MKRLVGAPLWRYAEALVLLALFLVPLVFSRSTLDVFNLTKLSLIWVCGIIAAWIWIVWSLERGVWVPPFPLGYAAAAFLGIYGLAAIFSDNRILSLLGIYHRYGGIIPTVLYALVMLVIVGIYWEQPEKLKAIPAAIALALIPMSVYMVIQAAGLDPITWRMPDGSSPTASLGAMGNSNFAGGYLAISLPFVAYLALNTSQKLAPWVTLSMILSSYALWLSGSRGAMIGAAAGLAFLGFLYREQLRPWMRNAAIGALMCGVALAVLVVGQSRFDRPPLNLEQAKILRTDTLKLRQLYWTTAWRIFLDHPILGTGPDTFASNYGNHRTTADGVSMGLAVADKPHNLYLEYAANSGILGLGAYLGMAGLALAVAVRKARDRHYEHRALLTAFASAFVAYLVQGFFSIDVPPLAFMGWVCLAGIAVFADPAILRARAQAHEQGGVQAETTDLPSRAIESHRAGTGVRHVSLARRRQWQTGTGVLALMLLLIGSRPLFADVKVKSAQLLLTDASFDTNRALSQALERVESAIRRHPIEAEYWRRSGHLHALRGTRSPEPAEKEDWYRKASRRFVKAHRLEPANVYIGMDLARLYDRWAREILPYQFGQADDWWRRTLAMDPTNWELKFHHAEFLSEWGTQSGREDLLRQSLQGMEAVAGLRPDQPKVWTSIGRISLTLGEEGKARDALNRAQGLAPHDPSIQRLLAKIKGT